ncbi:glutathione S-transferase [Pseudovirgaria hyperparasitica]|uniref:Glutathione S-transferase n=1 Tax=Pseudovirgaria hyperparasitica TaxID=470096 RepID=A0A6A6W7P4_9PEZI|nr:glutathione S-transferase [Pseudovirgaria hyperparasitica]KAF2758229.1 glutathione S-transferase [Pseudovirgaria hyperparasitica]
MPLEVYHLHLSQSERVVWLLEEMQVPYDLKIFQRDPESGGSPEELKKITSTGTAPFFRDTNMSPPVELFESMAIVDYILSVYSGKAPGTRMIRTPGDPDYVPYLSWLHYANGTLQPGLGRSMSLGFAGQNDSAIGKRFGDKFKNALKLVDNRLSKTRYLAGEELSAADAMTVFTLTTMRGFYPVNLAPFKNILRYLSDVAKRPAYLEALKKADGGMEPMNQAKTRKFLEFAAFRPFLDTTEDGVE